MSLDSAALCLLPHLISLLCLASGLGRYHLVASITLFVLFREIKAHLLLRCLVFNYLLICCILALSGLRCWLLFGYFLLCWIWGGHRLLCRLSLSELLIDDLRLGIGLSLLGFDLCLLRLLLLSLWDTGGSFKHLDLCQRSTGRRLHASGSFQRELSRHSGEGDLACRICNCAPDLLFLRSGEAIESHSEQLQL